MGLQLEMFFVSPSLGIRIVFPSLSLTGVYPVASMISTITLMIFAILRSFTVLISTLSGPLDVSILIDFIASSTHSSETSMF